MIKRDHILNSSIPMWGPQQVEAIMATNRQPLPSHHMHGMANQITGNSIVCSTVCSGKQQGKLCYVLCVLNQQPFTCSIVLRKYTSTFYIFLSYLSRAHWNCTGCCHCSWKIMTCTVNARDQGISTKFSLKILVSALGNHIPVQGSKPRVDATNANLG